MIYASHNVNIHLLKEILLEKITALRPRRIGLILLTVREGEVDKAFIEWIKERLAELFKDCCKDLPYDIYNVPAYDPNKLIISILDIANKYEGDIIMWILDGDRYYACTITVAGLIHPNTREIRVYSDELDREVLIPKIVNPEYLVSKREYDILEQLAYEPQGCKIHEIVSYTGSSYQSVCKTLAELIRKGYVARVKGRGRKYKITREGMLIYSALKTLWMQPGSFSIPLVII